MASTSRGGTKSEWAPQDGPSDDQAGSSRGGNDTLTESDREYLAKNATGMFKYASVGMFAGSVLGGLWAWRSRWDRLFPGLLKEGSILARLQYSGRLKQHMRMGKTLEQAAELASKPMTGPPSISLLFSTLVVGSLAATLGAYGGLFLGSRSFRAELRDNEALKERFRRTMEAAAEGRGPPGPIPAGFGAGRRRGGTLQENSSEAFSSDDGSGPTDDGKGPSPSTATAETTVSRWDQLRKQRASPPSSWDKMREDAARATLAKSSKPVEGTDESNESGSDDVETRRRKFDELMAKERQGGDDRMDEGRWKE